MKAIRKLLLWSLMFSLFGLSLSRSSGDADESNWETILPGEFHVFGYTDPQNNSGFIIYHNGRAITSQENIVSGILKTQPITAQNALGDLSIFDLYRNMWNCHGYTFNFEWKWIALEEGRQAVTTMLTDDLDKIEIPADPTKAADWGSRNVVMWNTVHSAKVYSFHPSAPYGAAGVDQVSNIKGAVDYGAVVENIEEVEDTYSLVDPNFPNLKKYYTK